MVAGAIGAYVPGSGSEDVPTGLLIVIICVASGEGVAPATVAMAATVRETLGVTVRVDEACADEACATPVCDGATDARGTLVARVDWVDGADTAVVHMATPGLVAERRVVFRPSDAPSDRGRSLAYLLASMVPDDPSILWPAPAPDAPSSPPAPPPPEPPPEEPPATTPVNERHASDRSAMDAERSPHTDDAADAPSQSAFALEAMGEASLGLFDDGTSRAFGGGLDIRYRLAPRLAAYVAADVRGGSVGRASATTLYVALHGGIAFRWLSVGSERPLLTAELGAGLGGARQSMAHFSSDDVSADDQSVWTPVGVIGLEAVWWVRPWFGLVLRASADILFTEIDVVVAGVQEAAFSLVREGLGLGIRADSMTFRSVPPCPGGSAVLTS